MKTKNNPIDHRTRQNACKNICEILADRLVCHFFPKPIVIPLHTFSRALRLLGVVPEGRFSVSRNLGLMRIFRSRFKQSKNCSFISRIYVLQSFVNFWVVFGDIWGEIVFLNGLVKFREIRNGEDLM